MLAQIFDLVQMQLYSFVNLQTLHCLKLQNDRYNPVINGIINAIENAITVGNKNTAKYFFNVFCILYLLLLIKSKCYKIILFK